MSLLTSLNIIIKEYSLISLLLISLILNFIIVLVYKFMTNQRRLKEIKTEMDGLKNEMKKHKENPQKLMDLQKQTMEKSLEQMKHTMKPMLVTMIPLLLIYGWLKNIYGPQKLLGPLTWVWVYIISSFIYSIILRKIMKVQ